MNKEGNHGIITLIDEFFSEMVPFATTILNLKTIMIEWNKMERYAKWLKLSRGIYELVERYDESMFTLALFLGDGVGIRDYIDFLDDNSECEFTGNISFLKKQDKMVTLILFDDFFSQTLPFTTTTMNLKKIIVEWHELKAKEVDKIKLVLTDDEAQIEINYEKICSVEQITSG